ncbi:MAG: copper chaperone PCu(A)C [Brachybacterium sp.]|nr:copper chaperone PCu(A)C [Brachybacterium sp.]MDN5899584.1 copper chaperone PCu(A)C [Brachybacterium sp.]
MFRTTPPNPASALPALTGARLPRRAALAALLLPLAACAAEPTQDSGAGADADADGVAADDGALTIADAWVKAAEEHMTSAFGILRNDTDTDLVLSGARTDASAQVELHETASDGSGGMSMQEKEGGFPLPAGEELVLEPGGNHLMLIDLAAPLLPGDEAELILEFADGTELPFTATVKDFAGAQEHYEPEGSMGSGASDGGGEHATGHGDDE